MKGNRSLIGRRAVLVFLSVTALLVPGAPRADADLAGCNFNNHVLQIIMGSSGVTVERSDNDILVDGATCGGEAGVATVNSTTLVDLYDNFGGRQQATISLAGGSFSPGLDTSESPEVNFQYLATLSTCDTLRIQGSRGADAVTWGGTLMASSANLNADETVDIDADFALIGGCVLPKVFGGPGPDSLSAAGGAGTGGVATFFVLLLGEGGDDLLRGGRNEDKLLGGAGADTIMGGSNGDQLAGGAGNDVLAGGGGSDSLAGNGGRDRLAGGADSDVLKGGAGRDVCRGGSGTDVFIGCETELE
jgi:Ca2+-binding RTX toxin-like protein